MEGVFLIATLAYIILFLKLYSYICTMDWLRNGDFSLRLFGLGYLQAPPAYVKRVEAGFTARFVVKGFFT